MARQFKIKDIAKQAGVSAGTVDRVLHNRGRVSERSRQAVEAVLVEVGYKTNIHTSAISSRKEYTVHVAMPTFSAGDYWNSIKEGIDQALGEFSDVKMECRYIPYNQYDIYSCRAAYDEIMSGGADAVILAPTFKDVTLGLCEELERREIPYAFVDTDLPECKPWAIFAADQKACGELMGRLLSCTIPTSGKIAIITSKRIGNNLAINAGEREKALRAFLQQKGYEILSTEYSPYNPELNDREIMEFLEGNPGVEGIAVLNSRGYVVADILSAHGIKDLKLFSFDMTANNIRCLREGTITALLCQSPEKQGFEAVKSILGRLLYNRPQERAAQWMPIDIIFPENLPFYRKS